MPARFDFEPSGGWLVEPVSIVLAPGELATVLVVGEGEDGASIDVRIGSVAPAPAGMGRGEILLTARVYYTAPFDPEPWIIGGLAVLAAIAGTGLTLRRLRPWEFRVARRPR